MKLLTKEVAARIPPLYSTEGVSLEKKVAVVKFFDPAGRFTYYVVEGNQEATDSADDDWIFFGYCVSPLGPDCDEWGNMALSEMRAVKGPFGLGIERDLHWEPGPIPELVGEASHG